MGSAMGSGRSEVSLERMGMRSRASAQTIGSRLVAREEVKSATAFYALFVRENTQF